jgi:hypothetical protein
MYLSTHFFVLPQATSKTHIITFYRNGIFTIDDGPPRSINDPSNFRFIESISKVAFESYAVIPVIDLLMQPHFVGRVP